MANTTDKSILTAAGKALLAQLNAEEKPLIIDKMIFANVPNRPEFPQPDDVVPTDHVVHQEGVEQRGRLSADSVIYSTTLTGDVGPFEFNWTGAYCSEYGVLVTIDHHALTPKSADEPGVAGNTLVRSIVLEYKDIAEITNITVDASSWQYNATPRMKKMDDDVAQAIIDQNGKDWFIEDGFLVTPQASAFNIKAGAGYVSGNRVTLEFDRNVQVPNKPSFIYVDAHREGTPTGEQVTLFDFVITAEEKDDYTDENGVKHFVCKIAQVLADGSVSDLRPEGQSASKSFVNEQSIRASEQSTGLVIHPKDINSVASVGNIVPVGTSALRLNNSDGTTAIYVMTPELSGELTEVNIDEGLAVIGQKQTVLRTTGEFVRLSVSHGVKRALHEKLYDSVCLWDWMTPEQIADTQITDPNQKPTIDLFDVISSALDEIGGLEDKLSAYIYIPTKTLYVPEGAYGLKLSGLRRLLVKKNNTRIIASGIFNTRFVHIGTGNAAEMIRFNAYACELSHITLDGGLPFTPDGTETYGVDVPLTLDQCAHFYSDSLNICNYRIRGKQCIHLWESYFNDLRIFNGGFFGTVQTPSAAIAFDERGKEDNTFKGFESNNIAYDGKVSLCVVGSYLRMTVPCFNIFFHDVIAEGRTWATKYASISEPKWIVGATSSNIIVHNAYTYAHEQPFECGAALIDVANGRHNIKFQNYRIYQELTLDNHYLEVTKLFGNSSSFPLEVDISVEDVGNARTEFGNSGEATLIQGKINYRSEKDRAFDDFMTTPAQRFFSGEISWIDGTFEVDEPKIYRFKGKAETVSQIDGGGIYSEYPCRAIANFNGVPGPAFGARIQKGVTVTRIDVGQYKATFDFQMPDDKYVVVPSANKLNNPTESIEPVSQTQTSFTLANRDMNGVYHDVSILNISVFR